MILNNIEYSVNPLTVIQENYFNMLAEDAARRKYSQLDDFMKKIENYSESKQKILMEGYFKSDWNKPTPLQIKIVKQSLALVRELAVLMYSPKLSKNEAQQFITKENCKEVYASCCQPEPPTLEETLEWNKKFRERILNDITSATSRTTCPE